jgi:hypothetical protein
MYQRAKRLFSRGNAALARALLKVLQPFGLQENYDE